MVGYQNKDLLQNIDTHRIEHRDPSKRKHTTFSYDKRNTEKTTTQKQHYRIERWM